jgi:hypothetical protein
MAVARALWGLLGVLFLLAHRGAAFPAGRAPPAGGARARTAGAARARSGGGGPPPGRRAKALLHPTSSGYLSASKDNGSELFYVFFEAEEPEGPLDTTPILLWLQVRGAHPLPPSSPPPLLPSSPPPPPIPAAAGRARPLRPRATPQPWAPPSFPPLPARAALAAPLCLASST